ncbi:hypothetical protein [Bacillus toyonensis]|uniref:hypothetical protein n=1 Tax=Bacillus toyonensis TaxID=155322 RepID=UPI002E24FC60|nr:hypothetical protein [Bacillus toyonensis]
MIKLKTALFFTLVLCVFFLGNNEAQANGKSEMKESNENIEVIIKLKENTDQDVIERIKVYVKKEFKYLNAIEISIPITKINELSEIQSSIDWIEYNQKLELLSSNEYYSKSTGDTMYHHNLIRLHNASYSGLSGKGVNIAIVDSGVDKDHFALQGKTSLGFNCYEPSDIRGCKK